MPGFNLDKIDQAVAAAKEEVKVAEDTANTVTDAVVFSEKAQNALQTAPGKMRKSLLAKLKPDLDAAEECLAKARLHKIPTVRVEVWKALIGQIISGPVASKKDAVEIVSRLTSGGYLIQDSNGTLTILGKSYKVSPDSMFDAADLKAVKEKWDGVPKTPATPETPEKPGFLGFRDRVRAAIRESSSDSVPDLMAGKEGIYRIFVPPQPPQIGSKIWLAGGLLFVESKKQIIEPLDILGGDKIEEVVAQMAKLGIRITARELHWDEPPRPERTPEGETAKKEVLNKTRSFFYMMKRGVRFYVWHAKIKKEETLTAEEFFLEGKIGMHVIDNEDTWHNTAADASPTNKTRWVSRPIFPIDRLEEGGGTFFQIREREVPDYLQPLLSNCRGRYPDAEGFAYVPQPLRDILTKKYIDVARKEGKMDLIDKLAYSLAEATAEPTPTPEHELVQAEPQ